LKLAAVTGWPFENFEKPTFTVKSYVLPPVETFGKPDAPSGTSWADRGPFPSG